MSDGMSEYWKAKTRAQEQDRRIALNARSAICTIFDIWEKVNPGLRRPLLFAQPLIINFDVALDTKPDEGDDG